MTRWNRRAPSIFSRISHQLGAVLLTLSVFAWIAPVSTALGQETEPAPPPIVEPEPEVSIPELIERADTTSAIIQEATDFLESGELDLAEITEALVDLESEISDVLAAIEGDLLDEQSLRELDLVDQRIAAVQSHLVAGTELVEQEAAELDGQRNALKVEADFYDALLADDRAADLPPAILGPARETLAKIADLRDRILERLNDVVASRARISEQRNRTDSAKRRISQAQDVRAASFLDPDSPPLWTSLISEWEPLGDTVTAA